MYHLLRKQANNVTSIIDDSSLLKFRRVIIVAVPATAVKPVRVIIRYSNRITSFNIIINNDSNLLA